MTRRHQLAAAAVLGISLMTAYAFGKGPFTPFSPNNGDANSTCPGGTCRPTPSIGNPVSPSNTPSYAPPAYSATPAAETSTPYPQPLQPASPSTVYHPTPYGTPARITSAHPVTVVATSAPANPSAVGPRVPDGQWKRELGPLSVTLRSANGTLAGSVVLPEEDEVHMQVDFVIEYSISSDGQLYGIVQSADLSVANVPKDTDFDEIVGLTQIVTKLIDQPVSMRCRVDGGTLTLKTFHLALPLDPQFLETVDTDAMLMLQGLFVGRYTTIPAPPVQAAVAY
jgi:hypothetical protein